jgi:hypothetical protein
MALLNRQIVNFYAIAVHEFSRLFAQAVSTGGFYHAFIYVTDARVPDITRALERLKISARFWHLFQGPYYTNA